jgi:hypothetical protein
LLPVNAVWIHGAGAIGPIERRALPSGFAVDEWMQGVYQLHGRSAEPVPANAGEIMHARDEHILAMIEARELDELERDWLIPLSRALRGAVFGALELIVGGFRLRVDRAAQFKFWRGARTPAQWRAW